MLLRNTWHRRSMRWRNTVLRWKDFSWPCRRKLGATPMERKTGINVVAFSGCLAGFALKFTAYPLVVVMYLRAVTGTSWVLLTFCTTFA